MPSTHDDSPYATPGSSSGGSGKSSRGRGRGRKSAAKSRGAAKAGDARRSPPAKAPAHAPVKAATKPAPAASGSRPASRQPAKAPAKSGRPSRRRGGSSTPLYAEPKVAAPKEPAAKRSRRRGRGSGTGESRLTSHPTGRAAYAETRQWLLREHGPVCAYCGRAFPVGTMTLDHVAPRRGQTAFDRRDNLVLACRECNAAKRDLAPLAFLLQKRSRAVHLLRYGSHLSEGLVELARSLVPEGTSIRMTAAELGFPLFADDEEDSPYA